MRTLRYFFLFVACFAAELAARRTASLITGDSTDVDHGEIDYRDMAQSARDAASYAAHHWRDR